MPLVDELNRGGFNVDISVADTRAFRQSLTRETSAAMLRNLKIVLPEIADGLIAEVRRGDWFSHETGNLKKKLYRSKPRITQSGGSIDVGWAGDAAVYGPVLEFGPTKRRWEIKPKGTTRVRVKGRGLVARTVRAGKNEKAIRALRFKMGGKVVYFRKVVRNWTPKSLRPHFGKALENYRPIMDTKLADATGNAFRISGVGR